MLRVQKQQVSSNLTPQKDMNIVKNKFEQPGDVQNSYQTLDQDTRRVSRPIRGNHHSGMSATTAPGAGKTDKGPAIISSKILNNPEDSSYKQMNLQEPTPSFISQKQACANEQHQAEQQASAVAASRKRQHVSAAISSNDLDESKGQIDREALTQSQQKHLNAPSYTPIRRNPESTY